MAYYRGLKYFTHFNYIFLLYVVIYIIYNKGLKYSIYLNKYISKPL